MLTVLKHLIFDAPWIGTYDRVCLGFGMEQIITQLAVKILFDDYSVVFLWDEEDNYFTREAETIIDIVYDLDKDWFRNLHQKETFTKLNC